MQRPLPLCGVLDRPRTPLSELIANLHLGTGLVCQTAAWAVTVSDSRLWNRGIGDRPRRWPGPRGTRPHGWIGLIIVHGKVVDRQASRALLRFGAEAESVKVLVTSQIAGIHSRLQQGAEIDRVIREVSIVRGCKDE